MVFHINYSHLKSISDQFLPIPDQFRPILIPIPTNSDQFQFQFQPIPTIPGIGIDSDWNWCISRPEPKIGSLVLKSDLDPKSEINRIQHKRMTRVFR